MKFMGICTYCRQPIWADRETGEHAVYLSGDLEGRFPFHARKGCLKKWLEEHPDYQPGRPDPDLE